MYLASTFGFAVVVAGAVMAQDTIHSPQEGDSSPALKPGFDVNALDKSVDPALISTTMPAALVEEKSGAARQEHLRPLYRTQRP